jgi:hypothetical protein
MLIAENLANALRSRLHVLDAALKAAGHLTPEQGLSLDGATLMVTEGGGLIELSPAAQAFIAGYSPVVPVVPDYGPDLLTEDELAEQAAAAVANLRAYRVLATPTAVQRKAFEDLVARILIRYVGQQVG